MSILFVKRSEIDVPHHPFGMGESTDLSAWQALLSGIGHPSLGPDHLLFMLGIALMGLKRSMKWIFPLLAVGLAGSALVQLQALPDLAAPWAEALVSLTLFVEGLIVLNLVSTKWLSDVFTTWLLTWKHHCRSRTYNFDWVLFRPSSCTTIFTFTCQKVHSISY
tara:strand:+ start:195 stop:686 length:492 start_codon:yes stop_codon:yes gene_type:complete